MINPIDSGKRKWTRRAWLRRVLLGTGGSVGALVAYGAGVEPFRPVLERVNVPLPNLPPALEGFTIAHLSDLHVQHGFPAERLRPVVTLTNALRPDLVALTGDYINDQQADESDTQMAACVRELSGLKARLGIFAVFGNHDFSEGRSSFPDPPRRLWDAAGITPLFDEAVPLRVGGVTLWVVGLRSSIKRPTAPESVLAYLHDQAFRLLLWHEPDRALESARAGASLQLSGHTHGGQVVVPGVGPLVLPPQGKKYPAGLFRVGGMPLYVTRGIGMLPPRIRFCCPPEVTLLTLRRA